MPSVTSMSCSDARSSCEYDFTAATSAEIAAGRLLHLGEQRRGRQRARHPLEAGFERVTVEHLRPRARTTRRRLRRPRARARCATRRRRRARRASRRALPRDRRPPAGRRAALDGVDLAPQRVDGDELLGRQRSLGEAHERRQQRVARVLQRVDRARRGRRRVVDLVREPGRERAERDERLPAARDSASMLRTVWKKPSIRCTPNGNHGARQLAERRRPGRGASVPGSAPRPVAR